jgi:hypothetical protein
MLQPSKDHPLPILWVLQRTSWWRRRGAVLESVSFLGKQQQSVQVDKFILWGQEILSRNNVPFPAATDCQPCGWFCFHRNVHACFLPSAPGTPRACLVHTAQNYQAIPFQTLCFSCLLLHDGSHQPISLLTEGDQVWWQRILGLPAWGTTGHYFKGNHGPPKRRRIYFIETSAFRSPRENVIPT